MDGKNEVRCRVEGGKVQELIREIRAEHRALVGQLIAVEAAGATGRPVPDEAKGALAGVVAHMEQEEAELYPALEPYVGTGTVTMTLRAEHAAIREALRGLDEGGASPPGVAADVARRLRDHIAREEKTLFDLAGRLLPEEEKGRGDEG